MSEFCYKTIDNTGAIASVMVLSSPSIDPTCIPIERAEFDMLSVAAAPPPPFDWKGEYAKAKTESERIDVLARRLGLKE